MLIELHSSLQDQLKDGAVDREIAIDALDNLALGRKEGKHILFGDRITLEALLTCDLLHAKSKSIFRRVLENVPQIGEFARTVERRIEVVANNIPGPTKSIEGTREVIRVPARYFADSMLVQPAVLLGEHRRDAEIFLIMARVYAVNNRLHGIPIEADLQGGGGSATANAYENLQRLQRRLCICIVDSDRPAPGAALGSTARGVMAVDDPIFPLSELQVLKYRELENLIPTRLFADVSTGDVNRMEAVSRLERLEVTAHAGLRHHLDLKDGTSLHKAILSRSPTSPEAKYWTSLLPTLVALGARLEVECQANGTCAAPERCRCILFPGFGETILDTLASRLNETTPSKVAEAVCAHTASEWARLGSIVLAWCCGAQRVAT